MDPAPFLRGAPFDPGPGVPYPRARHEPFGRLPLDTWAMASIPAGVRLELTGDASEVEIGYATSTDQLMRPGAGVTFAAWRGGEKVGEAEATLGEGTARVALGSGPGTVVVHLPEGMRPEVRSLRALGGDIEPAPAGARWLCYGDSIAEGWTTTEPALAWPSVVARDRGLDLCNLGYAGAARGEIVSAEHIAELEADVISITHGTNCWTRIPHSVELFRAGLVAFLDVVRQGHPDTPVLVCSPVLRPDAEDTPNRLGATLADLRAAMEEVAAARGDIELVSGAGLVTAGQLGDGIHPDDDGHAAIAAVLGPRLSAMVG